ncbi:MAG TPA: histidine phosphatase family protein [Bacillota bacterium]|nr:histidine phosphatase family protein [Bacillota bacterium]
MHQLETKVTVLRHGETHWNLERRFQGQLDSPLTQQGIAQAKAAGEYLKDENFVCIYCSDLGRTVQTAQLIAQKLQREIFTEVRLRERHLGIAQGLLRTEFKTKYPEVARQFSFNNVDFIIPGGESISQCDNRVSSWMTDMATRHSGQQILAVTHGLILSYILKRVLGIPLEARRRFSLFNASINRFSIKNGEWFLDSWGETGHTRNLKHLDEL